MYVAVVVTATGPMSSATDDDALRTRLRAKLEQKAEGDTDDPSTESEAYGEDDEMDDEDEGEDDDQSADDPEDTQAADLKDEVQELRKEFEETRQKLRNGAFEPADPEDVADDLTGDGDGGERDADDADEGEQRDNDGDATTRDEWLSEVN